MVFRVRVARFFLGSSSVFEVSELSDPATSVEASSVAALALRRLGAFWFDFFDY